MPNFQIVCVRFFSSHSFFTIYSVNFKKNEKAYNSEGSEVLKALKETEHDPREPGIRAIKFYSRKYGLKIPLYCESQVLYHELKCIRFIF